MVVLKQGVKVHNMTLAGMPQVPWYGLGDRPIVNNTGLDGKYSLMLNWTMPKAAAGVDGAEPTDDSGPSIFTVLQEQLGLKLVQTRGPVEVVVIDSIEQPSEN